MMIKALRQSEDPSPLRIRGKKPTLTIKRDIQPKKKKRKKRKKALSLPEDVGYHICIIMSLLLNYCYLSCRCMIRSAWSQQGVSWPALDAKTWNRESIFLW